MKGGVLVINILRTAPRVQLLGEYPEKLLHGNNSFKILMRS
jgi:hypothetical protein